MNISRYIEIKAAMPDSMRMKVDHIKRYLDEGKAAALIGAEGTGGRVLSLRVWRCNPVSQKN